MDDLAKLDDLVANLRRIDAAGVAIAEEARPAILEEARRTAAAGTAPDGTPWAPTKDGRKALPNAASAISAVVSGSTVAVITLVLRGAYVFHSAMKGKGRRPILPSLKDGLPDKYEAILRAAAKKVFSRVLQGGR